MELPGNLKQMKTELGHVPALVWSGNTKMKAMKGIMTAMKGKMTAKHQKAVVMCWFTFIGLHVYAGANHNPLSVSHGVKVQPTNSVTHPAE